MLTFFKYTFCQKIQQKVCKKNKTPTVLHRNVGFRSFEWRRPVFCL